MTDLPPHLQAAAREWELILRELHPEYAWIVTGREIDPAECERLAAATVRAMYHPDPSPQDTDAIADRHDMPATGPLNEHGLHEAA